ncbi:unnamed protein product [marine sediment metagenome]|uniref:Uncharacterized protein n=1 Tax=marine sediment metagenome TaxID=412755 RepID=X0XI73_9ZZZZ
MTFLNPDSTEIARGAAEHFGARILWRPDHLIGNLVDINPLIEYDFLRKKRLTLTNLV